MSRDLLVAAVVAAKAAAATLDRAAAHLAVVEVAFSRGDPSVTRGQYQSAKASHLAAQVALDAAWSQAYAMVT